jgi:hypothetical protein
MKNPFLLGIFWLFFFVLETSLPWEIKGISIKLLGSYFVLGYIFYALPGFSSFILASLVFIIQSSFTATIYSPLLVISSLYFWIFWIRRKTFSDNLASQAVMVLFIVLLNLNLIDLFRGTFNPFQGFRVISILIYASYLMANLFLGLFLFWWFQERGVLLEEKLLAFHAKKGQLNLFEARHLKNHRRKFKIQRRVRRRFGLKESW